MAQDITHLIRSYGFKSIGPGERYENSGQLLAVVRIASERLEYNQPLFSTWPINAITTGRNILGQDSASIIAQIFGIQGNDLATFYQAAEAQASSPSARGKIKIDNNEPYSLRRQIEITKVVDEAIEKVTGKRVEPAIPLPKPAPVKAPEEKSVTPIVSIPVTPPTAIKSAVDASIAETTGKTIPNKPPVQEVLAQPAKAPRAKTERAPKIKEPATQEQIDFFFTTSRETMARGPFLKQLMELVQRRDGLSGVGQLARKIVKAPEEGNPTSTALHGKLLNMSKTKPSVHIIKGEPAPSIAAYIFPHSTIIQNQFEQWVASAPKGVSEGRLRGASARRQTLEAKASRDMSQINQAQFEALFLEKFNNIPKHELVEELLYLLQRRDSKDGASIVRAICGVTEKNDESEALYRKLDSMTHSVRGARIIFKDDADRIAFYAFKDNDIVRGELSAYLQKPPQGTKKTRIDTSIVVTQVDIDHFVERGINLLPKNDAVKELLVKLGRRDELTTKREIAVAICKSAGKDDDEWLITGLQRKFYNMERAVRGVRIMDDDESNMAEMVAKYTCPDSHQLQAKLTEWLNKEPDAPALPAQASQKG